MSLEMELLPLFLGGEPHSLERDWGTLFRYKITS